MRRPIRTQKSSLWRCAGRLARDVRAATAIEYGLIVALIVIAMIGSFTAVAGVTTNMWNNVSREVINAR